MSSKEDRKNPPRELTTPFVRSVFFACAESLDFCTVEGENQEKLHLRETPTRNPIGLTF